MLNFNKKKYVSFDNLKSFNGLLQSSLKEKLDGYKSEIDTKVQRKFNELSGKVQTDSEVIDARKGEASLRAKIDVIDEDIKNVGSQLEQKANVGRVSKIIYLIDDYPKLDSEIYDDARIQRAINEVFENGGGTLRFTKGIYLFNNTVILKDKVSLEGVGCTDFRGTGNDVVQFKHTETFNGESIIEHEQETVQHYRSNYITNISFMGDSNRRINGIKTKHMGVVIERCSFTLLNNGIYLASSACSVLNCFGSSCMNTIFIGGTENYVFNLHDWGRINSILIKGDGNRVSNCKIFGDGSGISEYGVVVKGNRNMLSNNYIDKYKKGGIILETEGKSIYGCVIADNYLYDNGFESKESEVCGITLKTANGGYTIKENIITNNIIQTSVANGTANTDVGLFLYADNSSQIFDNIISSNIFSSEITRKVKNVGTDFKLNDIINNKNFKTVNSGVIDVKNGDTIEHGLDVTPTKIFLTGSSSRKCLNAMNITNEKFTVSMVNISDNSLVNVPEKVYWRAEL